MLSDAVRIGAFVLSSMVILSACLFGLAVAALVLQGLVGLVRKVLDATGLRGIGLGPSPRDPDKSVRSMNREEVK